MPGEGGFLGGAGRGLGASIRLLASAALLDRIFAVGFLTAGGFANTFLGERRLAAILFVLFALTLTLFFLEIGFLAGRLLSFFVGVACLLFFGCGRFFAMRAFFAIRAFFVFGAVVILPGRSGFREEAFFPLVALAAWIFLDADERLFVALVIRLLIGLLA